MLRSARERAVGFGYTAGWSAVRSAPRAVSSAAFQAAADAAAVRNGPGARQLRRNLRRVVGPRVSELRMDALVGDALRSYARYWLETFRLESMDHRVMVAEMDQHASGVEHLDAALARGNGVVFALPHTGNWDASGLWLIEHSGPFTTVAERLKPESVFDRFVDYRHSLGMEVVALSGGDRAPTDILSQRLRQNRVVCLVADRDLSGTGIEVDFFGERARLPSGPALLAAMTGASLHAVHTYFAGDKSWGHTIGPPIELPEGRLRERVTAGTQVVADRMAGFIAERPTDWHMLQRLWLADIADHDRAARPSPVPA